MVALSGKQRSTQSYCTYSSSSILGHAIDVTCFCGAASVSCFRRPTDDCLLLQIFLCCISDVVCLTWPIPVSDLLLHHHSHPCHDHHFHLLCPLRRVSLRLGSTSDVAVSFLLQFLSGPAAKACFSSCPGRVEWQPTRRATSRGSLSGGDWCQRLFALTGVVCMIEVGHYDLEPTPAPPPLFPQHAQSCFLPPKVSNLSPRFCDFLSDMHKIWSCFRNNNHALPTSAAASAVPPGCSPIPGNVARR